MLGKQKRILEDDWDMTFCNLEDGREIITLVVPDIPFAHNYIVLANKSVTNFEVLLE